MPTTRSVSDIKSKLLRPALTSFYEVEIDLPKGDGVLASRLSALRADGSEDQDVLNLRCSEASLPGSNLATLETTNTYHGVTERHAYRRVYDDRIDLTFYVDAEKYLAIRFFEAWIDGIMLQDTDNANPPALGKSPIDPTYTYRSRYSNNYVSPQGLKVRKFERDFVETSSVLEYTFVNSYPFSISAMPVSYESSSLLKCTVSFSYLRYVLNELKGATAFGSKQTPALNKQLAQSVADQAQSNDSATAGLGLGQGVVGGRTLSRRDIEGYRKLGASEAEIRRIQASVGDAPF